MPIRVARLITPVLRGWVNYFAAGDSNECFGFVKDWQKRRSDVTRVGPEIEGLRLEAVEQALAV
jgi:hypothetical protein